MSTLPTIVLTGVNGQVGYALQTALAPLGHVIALDRAQFDLSDAAQMTRVLDLYQPSIIVNPAAYTAVDKAESESDLAYTINAVAPQTMATWAAAHDALLVHYSTDYVFDGDKTTPYIETDSTNPQSVYGASKCLGEQHIINTGAAHIILRTSWVYGAHGNNFIKTILRLAQQRSALNIVADQVGTPTAAHYIASVTAQVLQQYLDCAPMDRQGLYGIYHLTSAGTSNWHQYAQHIVRRAMPQLANHAALALQCTPETIDAISSAEYPTPARRPMNSRLDCSKLSQHFQMIQPQWQDDVDVVVDQIVAGLLTTVQK